MNGFSDHGLDEGSFGEKGGIVKAFDAFPKAKPQYITQTSGGGKWTVAMMLVSFALLVSEFMRWWTGHETHTFVVEKGVGHSLQINMDMVIKMKCSEVHINVQDAAGDRILAGIMLKEDATNWKQWVDAKGIHQLGKDAHGRVITGEEYHEEGFGEEHVHDIVVLGGKKRAKFAKTPRVKGGPKGVIVVGFMEVWRLIRCRVTFISLQGVMDIRRWENIWIIVVSFNFSHIINELSFGPFYPSLLNPLDRTIAGTPNHFHKYQYFLSIVPTLYSLSPSTFSPSSSPTLLRTNQYAVTSQEHIVGERSVPGIFFKYDIEPLLLTVEESRDGFLRFVVKVVNVVSGVLVAGHWGFTITEWGLRVWGRRSGRGAKGMLDSGKYNED
ncbi:putative endoplasmic reticulum-golgi intermediate compartment protein 2 protein [Botrytis fragariae]|uniref:Endoplasmic reticulum-Golgi intermediate compartment protein n=1 Tax=Botrytis fragariae TaxID=1964551 RepID=A0A8H6AWE7_9HELO|nr:putative endoplasmic reticulum-golgi intermediate compartment protein 2 protein [Botrytis fragariae]KAF5875033.1 putative endoplasmic reticulum-golgi intermediate compartment protein 2 protein [Botrytis fragariae]